MFPFIAKKSILAIDWISKGFFYLAQFVILAMMLTTCYDVLMRYFLARPTTWAVELNAMLLVFITFLAGAELVKNDQHIQMDIIFNRLSIGSQKYLSLFISLFAFLLCLILAWTGAKATLAVYKAAIFTAGAFRMPMWIPYAFIPAGSILMGLQYLFKITASFCQKGRGTSQ